MIVFEDKVVQQAFESLGEEQCLDLYKTILREISNACLYNNNDSMDDMLRHKIEFVEGEIEHLSIRARRK